MKLVFRRLCEMAHGCGIGIIPKKGLVVLIWDILLKKRPAAMGRV
jgi:hypothetical protein